jgi:uncharacterized membrane protein YbaN (DUF454 family)
MLRLATIGIGYAFLALGVLGLFLPILQGVVFLVIGLLILSRHAAWAQRLLGWMKRRHPRVHQTIERAEILLRRWQRTARVRVGRWFRPAAPGR